MNIGTAKVCVPWFAILSSKFPAEHLFLLLEWFTPFLSPLILLQSILVSSSYLSVNIVVLYSHLYWNLKREVSWLDKEFKIVIIFRGRSREDSLFQAFYYLNAWNRLQRRKKWICESRCQVSDHLHFLAEYFDLNPYPYTNTVYARSAFYTQSGIFYPGLQSAVCVLHWLVFHLCSIYLLYYVLSIFFLFHSKWWQFLLLQFW